MSVDALLDRLDGVRRTGDRRWIALCPAHLDRRPSLAIRELDDGRALAHCFAGCPIEDVLAAVGLEFDALYPERPFDHHVARGRRPFPAADILRTLSTEITIVVVYAADLRAGRTSSHQDHERFLLACSRISQADGVCCHAKR